MSWMSELTPMNMVLVSGVIWLSGVFLWLIKRFVASYDKNTTAMVGVKDTLEGVDRKLDTAANRDIEIVRTLAAIHARGVHPAQVEVIHKDAKKP